MKTTKLIREISKEDFEELVEESDIFISTHALDHLSQSQRNAFKTGDLTRTIQQEIPKGIGLQRNGRYAAFYKRKEGFLKIIVESKNTNLEIITFMICETMPNLKRL